MKQTGTKSAPAFKKVAQARSAEKKALRNIANVNRQKIKTKLAKKYGY